MVMTEKQRIFLEACRDRYKADLCGNIMPFWMEHGLDKNNGGVYTCLDRDGSLMDPTKSVWFQGRFAYVCAYAYNNISKEATWLEASKSCIDFIERHCIDTDGHMFFTVTADGRPVQKRRYVFSECFAIIAMAEYAKASSDRRYADRAFELFKHTLDMLSSPDFLAPKTSVASLGHSITMILINVAGVLRQVVESPLLDEKIDESIEMIMSYFMHPEFKAVLETVSPTGGFIDTCAGRTINPGHSIETAWFIMEAAMAEKDEAKRKKYTDAALTILNWSWDWGWDKEYGGIINFRDCRNLPPQDYSQDMKFWWPQCEAIIAMLYAYLISGEETYLERYRMADEWAYSHFADSEYPEWYGYLHRDGTVAQPAKGNIFKGPFHIPRMMVKSVLLCDEILKTNV